MYDWYKSSIFKEKKISTFTKMCINFMSAITPNWSVRVMPSFCKIQSWAELKEKKLHERWSDETVSHFVTVENIRPHHFEGEQSLGSVFKSLSSQTQTEENSLVTGLTINTSQSYQKLMAVMINCRSYSHILYVTECKSKKTKNLRRPNVMFPKKCSTLMNMRLRP